MAGGARRIRSAQLDGVGRPARFLECVLVPPPALSARNRSPSIFQSSSSLLFFSPTALSIRTLRRTRELLPCRAKSAWTRSSASFSSTSLDASRWVPQHHMRTYVQRSARNARSGDFASRVPAFSSTSSSALNLLKGLSPPQRLPAPQLLPLSPSSHRPRRTMAPANASQLKELLKQCTFVPPHPRAPLLRRTCSSVPCSHSQMKKVVWLSIFPSDASADLYLCLRTPISRLPLFSLRLTLPSPRRLSLSSPCLLPLAPPWRHSLPSLS